MTNEKDIRDMLLSRMEPSNSPDVAAKILARDAVRVRRVKWITIVAWAVVGMSFVCGSLLMGLAKTDDSRSALGVAGMAMLSFAQVMAPFALAFTISLYIRSRTLTIRQIQARLSGIENLLREILHDKTTA